MNPQTNRIVMKKFEKEKCQMSLDTRSPFGHACQQMHTMANVCQNYLLMVHQPVTQTVYVERGCMRSARLACLTPGSHEVSSRSALQIVLLPASFDHFGIHLYDHTRWQLLVYSWLNRQDTLQIIRHLKSQFDCSSTSFFLVMANGCERIDC